MRKKIKAADVAIQAGVSTATVSYVFSGRKNANVPEATRQRVLEAARLIDYRPNRVASSLARGRTHLVGLVSRLDTFDIRIAAPIRGELTQIGYQILLTQSAEHFELEENEVRVLLEYQVDALICVTGGWGMTNERPWLSKLIDAGLPCIIVNDIDPSGRLDSVVSANSEGAQMLVHHLVERGHTRIAHIHGGDNSYNAEERKRGYLAGLVKAGIPANPEWLQCGGFNDSAGYEGAMRILSLNHLPTAIIAANDSAASGVYHAVTDRGLRIPEDIAVAGFGNEREAEALRMTTVDQFPGEMGQIAVARVLERLHNPGLPPQSIISRVKLLTRRTG